MPNQFGWLVVPGVSALTVLMLVMWLAPGCSRPSNRTDDPWVIAKGTKPKGVPADAVMIAKGETIEFVAPTDGFIYFVTSGHLRFTRRVSKTEHFQAVGSVGDQLRFDYAEVWFEPVALIDTKTNKK